MTDLHASILRYLRNNCRGPENAVSGTVLAERYGISGQQLREVISALVDAGEPVCGTPTGGYHYAVRQTDGDHTLAYLADMIRSFSHRKYALEKALDRTFGPPTLWGE